MSAVGGDVGVPVAEGLPQATRSKGRARSRNKMRLVLRFRDGMSNAPLLVLAASLNVLVPRRYSIMDESDDLTLSLPEKAERVMCRITHLGRRSHCKGVGVAWPAGARSANRSVRGQLRRFDCGIARPPLSPEQSLFLNS